LEKKAAFWGLSSIARSNSSIAANEVFSLDFNHAQEMQGVGISWVLPEDPALKRSRVSKLTFLMRSESFLKHERVDADIVVAGQPSRRCSLTTIILRAQSTMHSIARLTSSFAGPTVKR